jgi:ribosome-associated protein
MIVVTEDIALDDREIVMSFIRASGPGGQNVNKVSTAVQIRFDAGRSQSLRDDVRARLKRIAGRRLTRDGVVVITAQRFRTQERNRQDAIERLVEMIRAAAVIPRPRKATRPSRASKRRVIENKRRHGTAKRQRSAKLNSSEIEG